DEMAELASSCTGPGAPAGPALARCTCLEALSGNTTQCGYVTPNVKSFCENPTRVSITIGFEDGRIGRRVK
ncbi:MAG: hypothetical protein FJ086_20575, partial [Deltaproteobacteria bacterium]|nr:hypothetical protein [Deltaproteobacteria bacterium]